jgi:hypothetical protein
VIEAVALSFGERRGGLSLFAHFVAGGRANHTAAFVLGFTLAL